MKPEKLILFYPLCPGDTLVATVSLEMLHAQYPGKYLTDVEGTATEGIFAHNPHVTKLDRSESFIKRITLEYPLINQSNQRPMHFTEAYCRFLGEKLGIRLDCTANRPFLYISEEEKGWISQVEEGGYKGKFWLVCSGVKTDYTVKQWDGYQKVIDELRGAIQFVQIGEAGHNHPLLDGVIDLRGKTDTRQLIRLAYHASGGLGGVSFLHHIFAAFQKPFVCVASGMEPASWECYNTEVYLTRQGRLPCCQHGGCWKARTVPLDDGDHKDMNLCVWPVFGKIPVPRCMAMIHPSEVVAAIRSYYDGGVLSC